MQSIFSDHNNMNLAIINKGKLENSQIYENLKHVLKQAVEQRRNPKEN